jgi:transcriptional regulator with XRE-family HTH domain
MTRSLSKDIAKVVRGLLAERRITVQEFAAKMGEPNSSVARWINGGGTFKTDKLDDMADALGMETADLVMLAISKRQAGGLSAATEAEREDLRNAIDRVRPTDEGKSRRRRDVG